MNALNKMDYVEKAKLLYQLFPEEMPELIDFIEEMCIANKIQEPINRKLWADEIDTYELFLKSRFAVELAIKKQGRTLKSCYVFSEQLFTKDRYIFTNYSLLAYASKKKKVNPKFHLAVELLFQRLWKPL